MTNTRVSRRTLLTGMGGAAAFGASACGVTGSKSPSSNGSESNDGTVNALFMKQAGYSEKQYHKMLSTFEDKHHNINVKPSFVSYEALHDKIVSSASSGSYDIVLVDVIWTAEFAAKHLLKDITDKVPNSWHDEMFPGVLKTGKYKKKYYGIPSGPSTKLMFYNSHYLRAVNAKQSDIATWDGLLEVATDIQKRTKLKHPIAWSWAQEEALICDFAQLLGAFGGHFLNDNGELIINNKQGVKTLSWMKDTLDKGVTNKSSTSFVEDDVSKALANSGAAFGLNWESTYRDLKDKSVSKIVEDAHVMATPKGPSGQRPGVNGAMTYGIPSGAKNPGGAWELIKFLSSRHNQDKYVSGGPPNWKASFKDKAVVKQQPEAFDAEQVAFEDSILRPQVENYNAVSHTIQVELQKALSGSKSPKAALDSAVRDGNKKIKK